MVSTRAKAKKGPASEQPKKRTTKLPSISRHVRFEESTEPATVSSSESLPQRRSDGGTELSSSIDGFQLKDLKAKLAENVNQRLEDARSYFSTQEVNHTWNFESKFEMIDAFLRMLSAKKVECNVRLYRTVKSMAEAHRGRIRKASGGLLPYDFPGKELTISTRLPTTNPMERVYTRMALGRRDRPPFTLEPRKDDAEFFRNLYGDDEIGELMQLNQRKAYLKGIFDVKFAATKGDVETFDARATDRGRQAAALQIALQSFAGCMVQHYGDQDHQVMDWPRASVPEPFEPVLLSSGEMQNPLDKIRMRNLENRSHDGIEQSTDSLDDGKIWAFSRNLPAWVTNRNFFSLQFWSGFNSDSYTYDEYDDYDEYDEFEGEEEPSERFNPYDGYPGKRKIEDLFKSDSSERTRRFESNHRNMEVYNPEKFHQGLESSMGSTSRTSRTRSSTWFPEDPSVTQHLVGPKRTRSSTGPSVTRSSTGLTDNSFSIGSSSWVPEDPQLTAHLVVPRHTEDGPETTTRKPGTSWVPEDPALTDPARLGSRSTYLARENKAARRSGVPSSYEPSTARYNPDLFHHPERNIDHSRRPRTIPYNGSYPPAPSTMTYNPFDPLNTERSTYPRGLRRGSTTPKAPAPKPKPTPMQPRTAPPKQKKKVPQRATPILTNRPMFEPVAGIDFDIPGEPPIGSIMPAEIMAWDGKTADPYNAEYDSDYSDGEDIFDVGPPSKPLPTGPLPANIIIRHDSSDEDFDPEYVPYVERVLGGYQGKGKERMGDRTQPGPRRGPPGVIATDRGDIEGADRTRTSTRNQSSMPPPPLPSALRKTRAPTPKSGKFNPFDQYRDPPVDDSTTEASPRTRRTLRQQSTASTARYEDDESYGDLMPPEIMAWERDESVTPRKRGNPFAEAEEKWTPTSARGSKRLARGVPAFKKGGE